MEVETLVVTHNSANHIVPCLDSLLGNGAAPIVVDTNSTDSTIQLVSERSPDVRLIQVGDNIGYGKALNLGFGHTIGKYVLLSNSDVVYMPSSVGRMVEFLEKNSDVGLVGPQLVFPDGRWQWSYGELPGIWAGLKDAIGVNTLCNACRYWLWPRKIDRRPRDVPYVVGAALLVRRKAFEAIGGFDESFFPGSDDCDLCARMQRSRWRTVFCPQVEVVHIRGGDFAHVPAAAHLKRLVETQIRLARKYLPAWQARLYFWLEHVQFWRLSLIYHAVGKLAPERMREVVRKKGIGAHELTLIWRDKRRRES